MRVKSRIVDLFVVPIGIYTYPRHQEWKETVYKIVDKYKDTKFEMPSDKGGIQHFFNSYHQDVFRDVNDPDFQEILRNFEQFTKVCLRDFYDQTFGTSEYDEMLITNSWINLTKNGNWLEPHYHGNTILACNYFVNFTKDHTPLSFCNPFKPSGASPTFSIETKDYTRYTIPNVECDAREGDLVIWQAGMYHGFDVVKSEAKDARITMAMNGCPDTISTGPYRIKIGVYNETN